MGISVATGGGIETCKVLRLVPKIVSH